MRTASVAIVLGLAAIGLIRVGRWHATTKPVEGPILARVITDGDRVPSTLAVRDAEPLAEMNAHFRRIEGWIGADGAHSVPFGPDRTLWLFSDTWVGEVREGKRFNATIVNNCVVVQQGSRVIAMLRLIHRSGHIKGRSFDGFRIQSQTLNLGQKHLLTL